MWDAHLGGWPVALVGIESRPLPRFGPVPADGPEQLERRARCSRSPPRRSRAPSTPRPAAARSSCSPTSPASTARPSRCAGCSSSTAPRSAARSSTSTARSSSASSRASTAAPSSSSRGALNDGLETLALEGAHASVIGGAPAAAVVFAREVDVRTRRDPRIAELDERIAAADGGERQRLRGEREARWTEVRSEKLGELAAEFDAIHCVERAVEVGSVDRIVARGGAAAVAHRGRRARDGPATPSGWPRRRAAAGRAAARARRRRARRTCARSRVGQREHPRERGAARAVRWTAWMRRSTSLRRRSARPSRSRSSSTPTIGLLSIRSRRPERALGHRPLGVDHDEHRACLLRIPCAADRALEALGGVLGDERSR